jgi:hypothetical protein
MSPGAACERRIAHVSIRRSRSDSPVAICTGSPADSRPNQRFNSSREEYTEEPRFSTGIPDLAHRCATATGCPRNAAICCQPFNWSGSGLGCLRLAMAHCRMPALQSLICRLRRVSSRKGSDRPMFLFGHESPSPKEENTCEPA